MKISIHQPEFLPWPGFFNKIKNSDIFVFLDDVQFSKNYVHNRNILMNNGEPTWYTLPVFREPLRTNINEIKINHKDKNFKTFMDRLTKNYEHELIDKVVSIVSNSEKLFECNINLIKLLANKLNFNLNYYLSSEIKKKSIDPTQRLIDIIKYFNATTYISGPSGEDYLNLDIFNNNSLNIDWLIYNLPAKNYIKHKFQYSFFHWYLIDSYKDLMMDQSGAPN